MKILAALVFLCLALVAPAFAQAATTNSSANVGQSVTLNVTFAGGTGGPLTFTWFKNSVAVPTAPNAATWVVTNSAASSDAASYQVAVANSAGSTYSQVVILAVIVPPPPVVAPTSAVLTETSK